MIDTLAEVGKLAALTAYGQTTGALGTVVAEAVWDGQPRGLDDITAYFITEAQKGAFRSMKCAPKTGDLLYVTPH